MGCLGTLRGVSACCADAHLPRLLMTMAQPRERYRQFATCPYWPNRGITCYAHLTRHVGNDGLTEVAFSQCCKSGPTEGACLLCSLDEFIGIDGPTEGALLSCCNSSPIDGAWLLFFRVWSVTDPVHLQPACLIQSSTPRDTGRHRPGVRGVTG